MLSQITQSYVNLILKTEYFVIDMPPTKSFSFLSDIKLDSFPLFNYYLCVYVLFISTLLYPQQ